MTVLLASIVWMLRGGILAICPLFYIYIYVIIDKVYLAAVKISIFINLQIQLFSYQYFTK